MSLPGPLNSLQRPPQCLPAVAHQSSKAETVAVVVAAVAVAVVEVAAAVFALAGVPTFFRRGKSEGSTAVADVVVVCTLLAEQICMERCKEACLRLQARTA